MAYRTNIGSVTYSFPTLRTLLAKASPSRSGDDLAGISAGSNEERVAAQITLADVPLHTFLRESVIPYETDEVTRLIWDDHSETALAPIASFTVGEFREWLLNDSVGPAELEKIRDGLTPEMVAA